MSIHRRLANRVRLVVCIIFIIIIMHTTVLVLHEYSLVGVLDRRARTYYTLEYAYYSMDTSSYYSSRVRARSMLTVVVLASMNNIESSNNAALTKLYTRLRTDWKSSCYVAMHRWC